VLACKSRLSKKDFEGVSEQHDHQLR